MCIVDIPLQITIFNDMQQNAGTHEMSKLALVEKLDELDPNCTRTCNSRAMQRNWKIHPDDNWEICPAPMARALYQIQDTNTAIVRRARAGQVAMLAVNLDV